MNDFFYIFIIDNEIIAEQYMRFLKECNLEFIAYLQDISYINHKGIRKRHDRNPLAIFPYLEAFDFIKLEEYSESNAIRMRR